MVRPHASALAAARAATSAAVLQTSATSDESANAPWIGASAAGPSKPASSTTAITFSLCSDMLASEFMGSATK